MRSAHDASVSTARAHLRVKPLPEKAGLARTSGAGPAFLDVGFGTLRNRLQLNVKNPALRCARPSTIALSLYSRAGSATVLVARWVRVVSATRRVITWPVITWRVVSTGRSSTEGGGADGSTYRHSRTYTTIVATTVNTAAIDATAIVCGRVS
jgi:hypothetical protein